MAVTLQQTGEGRRGLVRRSIGAKIQEARRARGLSQAELAGKIGVSAAYISQLESGDRIPSAALCRKIGEVTNHTWTELVMGALRAKGSEEIASALDSEMGGGSPLGQRLTKCPRFRQLLRLLEGGLPEDQVEHYATKWFWELVEKEPALSQEIIRLLQEEPTLSEQIMRLFERGEALWTTPG